MKLEFPIKMSYSHFAISYYLIARNTHNKEILYIEDRAYLTKSRAKIFNNSEATKLLYSIESNIFLDFFATYTFSRADNQKIGSMQRKELQSIFQPNYKIFNSKGDFAFKVIQEKPWVLYLNFIFNGAVSFPDFVVTIKNGKLPILKMKKKINLFKTELEITCEEKDISENDRELLVVSLLMIAQLERHRN